MAVPCPMYMCSMMVPMDQLPAHFATAHPPERVINIMENNMVWPHQKTLFEELQGLTKDSLFKMGCKILDYKCTGSGKTSCLTLYPYALKAKRTLILSPNKKTCQEIMKQLKGSEDGSRVPFLRAINALPGDQKDLVVKLITESGSEAKNDIRVIMGIMECDVVVSTACKVSNSRAEPPKAGVRRAEARNKKDNEAAAAQDDKAEASTSKKRKPARSTHELSEWITAFIKKSQELITAGKRPMFDLIIFDEGHHIPCKTWTHILDTLGSMEWEETDDGDEPYKRKPYLAYCTGTPDRITNLTDFPFDKMLKPFTMIDALKTHHLANGLFAGPFAKNIVMLNVVNEAPPMEQDRTDLSCQMTCMRVVAHLLEEKRAGSQVPHRALVEVDGIENCKALCSAIEAAQLPIGQSRVMRAEVIYGSMSDSLRMEVLKKFTSRNLDEGIDVLINDQLLNEGFDEALISVSGVFKRHRTKTPFEQFVGRAVRPNPKGQNVAIQFKDNVCHIVTHSHYEQVPLFKEYTQQKVYEKGVLVEDEDGLLARETEAAISSSGLDSELDQSDDESDSKPGPSCSKKMVKVSAPKLTSPKEAAGKALKKAAGRANKAITAGKAAAGKGDEKDGSEGDEKDRAMVLWTASPKMVILRRYLFPTPKDLGTQLLNSEHATYFKSKQWQVEDIPINP